ncbi:MAG: translational GTPase TypA [Pseudomonadales bacterium]|nr:translational GTPase TypA [Pseudomonadales bacterium]
MTEFPTEKLRNIAIIAHVDHGKTTLVDELLGQSGTLKKASDDVERVMDSNDLEKERGITILSKTTAVNWNGYRINIVDTPGHADFGGEVERILSMVDSVLLLVDAVEGPMPQTRFVTEKAFAQGLNPVVVINKVDRQGARPDWVIDQVFDLFDNLGATDEQLDFPIVYASAIQGISGLDHENMHENMGPLFETIVEKVEPPKVDPEAPFQMQITTLDYSSYVGVIGIGRITQGRVTTNTPVVVLDDEGKSRKGRVLKIMGHLGLDRIDIDEASAGDIICITGVDPLSISDTLCDPDHPVALPPLTVDEPTVTMQFMVNSSPFSGKDGKYVTSRNIRDRLDRELIHNVALRVEDTENPDCFRVSGRGELHLGILLETMRREGYELAISQPEVIIQEIDGVLQEPFEDLIIDVDEEHQGSVIEALGSRRGELKDMAADGKGRIRISYTIPSRSLIGFRTEFITMTSGTGTINHNFSHYGPAAADVSLGRKNGVLISNGMGKASGFALFNLQARGRMIIDPSEEIYEGMVIGIHSRDNDLTVNALKGKQLTNVRASGTDENIVLTSPIRFTLEEAMEFIEPDELVEITPNHIRIRKKDLTENERKRSSRSKDA